MLVVFLFESDVVVRSEGSCETVGNNGAKRSGLELGSGLLAEDGMQDHFEISIIYRKVPSVLEISLFSFEFLF